MTKVKSTPLSQCSTATVIINDAAQKQLLLDLLKQHIQEEIPEIETLAVYAIFKTKKQKLDTKLLNYAKELYKQGFDDNYIESVLYAKRYGSMTDIVEAVKQAKE
jgi:undecaprenyl pyrophosphate synthase